MSKKQSDLQTAAQKITASLSQQVTIKKHQLSSDDMLEFVEHVKAEKIKNPEVSVSLTKYVTDKFYKGQKGIVVVPDLTGVELDNGHSYGGGNYIDLSGVDFSGSVVKNTKFNGCDLTGAVFTDTDLDGAYFDNTKIKDIDFRGANLVGCEFGDSYDSLMTYDRSAFTDGVKFSMSSGLGRRYADIKSDMHRQLEHKQLKAAKSTEVNEYYENELTLAEKTWLASGFASGNEQYDKLAAELVEMQSGKYPEKDYVMHKTFQRVFGSQGSSFDPCYKRGSSAEERDQPKQYIRTSREDVEAYLLALKDNSELTLNDFVKERFVESGGELTVGAMVHADLSSSVDLENNWHRVDLSGLDFTGANLQSTNFSGSNIEGANFTNANISNASFEGAIVDNAKFIGTNAKDVNFFGADLASAEISGSNFTRAYMSKSNAMNSQVTDSNFDFADIRNGKWDGVEISGSTFNFADLEGVSLANAVIRKTQMQHANLDNAILENCQLIESDLTRAFMANAKAEKLKLEQVILKDVDARGIDLSGAEIDELSRLEGIDLANAIMEKVKADRVNFVGANMEGVRASEASLKEAILTDVNMRFAELEGAVLEGVNASGVDMTGANLTDVQAKGANFTKATLEGMTAHRADFEGAVMEGANLRGVQMREAILEKVNLKKADLRNAEMVKAKLAEAQMEGAQVNDGTDLHGAHIEGVTGILEHEDLNGEKTKISVEDKVEHDNQVQAAREVNPIQKWLGKIIQGAGGIIDKIGGIIEQPLSTKWGRIIGAVVGAVAVGLFAASVVATGGASLAVAAAVVGGAVAVGGLGGAVAGHYTAKHMGLSTVIGVVGGGAVGLGPGAIAGAGVAIAANQVAKLTFGQSIDKFVGNLVSKADRGVKALGRKIGLSEKQEELLANQQQAQEAYQAPIREPQLDVEMDRGQAKMCKKNMAQKPAIVIPSTPIIPPKQQKQSVAKGQEVSQELQVAARNAGQEVNKPKGKASTPPLVSSKKQESSRSIE